MCSYVGFCKFITLNWSIAIATLNTDKYIKEVTHIKNTFMIGIFGDWLGSQGFNASIIPHNSGSVNLPLNFY